MEKIYDVFISYRRKESDGDTLGTRLAQQLYGVLRSHGLRVFLDTEKMEHGKDFVDQLKTAISNTPHYMLIATPGAFEYRGEDETGKIDYVREEMKLACALFNGNRTIHVFNSPGFEYIEEHNLPDEIKKLSRPTWNKLSENEKDNELIFKSAFDEITEVNRQNIWYGAHRWFEGSKIDGGRFANLHIEESILPPVKRRSFVEDDLPINVYKKEGQGENAQGIQTNKNLPFIQTIDKSNDNIYLIGEGGIGKTTALMHIMKNSYEKTEYKDNIQIPIFIELSFAPDSKYGEIYNNGESTFIRRSIFRQIRKDENLKQVTSEQIEEIEDVFSIPKETAVNPINSVFGERHDSPEYLLLLDGMNEVSTTIVNDEEHRIYNSVVYQMIMDEIEYLAEKCPNVQVVLTSRSDDAAINNVFTRFYLSGINDENIKSYLGNQNMSVESINEALEDDDLKETLSIPFFLTLYAKIANKNEVVSRGEILKAFLNERAKNIEDYSAQSRLEKAEKDMQVISAKSLKGRMTAEMLRFILDFILPEIAWNMEKEGLFSCKPRYVKNWVLPLLTDFSELAIAGDYGCELFDNYRSISGKSSNIASVVKKITDFYGTETDLANTILMSATTSLGLLYLTKDGYGFIHQHLRDYFASIKIINTIRLSVYMFEEGEKELALECMNRVFKDEPISISVRRFVGEYLGEHKNKPFFENDKWNYAEPKEKCDRNLIKRTLAIYRGHFEQEVEDGNVLWALIEILKDVRKDLSGFDFSYLDLWNIRFNEHFLSHVGIPAVFTCSKLNFQTFGPYGQSIGTACFSPDGERILTGTYSNDSLKIWDTKKLQTVKELKVNKTGIKHICFNSTGEYFLAVLCDDTTRIWEAKTFKEIGFIDKTRTSQFTPNGKKIASTHFCNHLKITDLKSLKQKVSEFDSGSICWATYSSDGKIFIGIFFTLQNHEVKNVVKIWNCKTGEWIGELNNKKYEVSLNHDCPPISFNRKSDRILLMTKNHEAVIWDLYSLEEIHMFENISAAAFNPVNDTIVVSYKDGFVKTYETDSFTLIGKIFVESRFYTDRYCCFSGDGSKFLLGNDLFSNIENQLMKTGTIKGGTDGIKGIFYIDDESIFIDTYRGTFIMNRMTHIINGFVYGFSLDIQNNRLVSAQYNKVVIYDLEAEKYSIIHIIEHSDWINTAEFNSSGKKLITSSIDGVVKIWDYQTFINTATLTGYSAYFCVDDSVIITTSKDNNPIVYDSKSLNKQGELIGDFAGFNSSRTQVITTYKFNTFIWDIKTFKKIIELRGRFIADSPKGNIIVTLEDNYSDTIIWDFEKQIIIATLNESFQCFSHNGERIVTLKRRNGNAVLVIRDCKSFETLTEIEFASYSSMLPKVCYDFNDKNLFVYFSEDETIKIFETSHYKIVKCISVCCGTFIFGCDLTALHPDSFLSDEEKKTLYQHGAAI